MFWIGDENNTDNTLRFRLLQSSTHLEPRAAQLLTLPAALNRSKLFQNWFSLKGALYFFFIFFFTIVCSKKPWYCTGVDACHSNAASYMGRFCLGPPEEGEKSGGSISLAFWPKGGQGQKAREEVTWSPLLLGHQWCQSNRGVSLKSPVSGNPKLWYQCCMQTQ